MPTNIQFPEWRKENEATKYPFANRATLTNAEGRLLTEGTFLDAALYPVGAGEGLFLSSVTLTHKQATVGVGTTTRRDLATGTFDLVAPPDVISLADAYGRPAGVLVSEGTRLAIFQSWGVGTHEFTRDQTEFCATCVFPAPEVGVRAIRLETGEVFVGDVWLVGDDGVVLRTEDLVLPADCGRPAEAVRVVRVDVVGDPLFRRRLCQSNDLFATPRFVKTIRVVGPNQAFDCAPDAFGELKMVANNALASDTVLRITPTAAGLKFGAVGSGTGV